MTPSLTYIYGDRREPLVCIYRHTDGYPDEQGKDLARILSNEFVGSDPEQTAVQVLVGMIRLAPADWKGVGDDTLPIGTIYIAPWINGYEVPWIYRCYPPNQQTKSWLMEVWDNTANTLIYEGTPDNFPAWANAPEQQPRTPLT